MMSESPLLLGSFHYSVLSQFSCSVLYFCVIVKCVVWAFPVCTCVMCTVLCVGVAWALTALAFQIDAVDLIKPVGLHVECQHCHQAQWEPNGGIGRIDPVDSTASAPVPQSEAPPIEGNDPQLGTPTGNPHRDGRGGGGRLSKGRELGVG